MGGGAVGRTHPRRLLDALRDAVRPPDLRTDEGRSASRLELFFDLAFVLVVAELAIALREDVTWQGEASSSPGCSRSCGGRGSARPCTPTASTTNDVVYRFYKLGSMAAVIGMAASATEATGERFGVFVACQLVLRAMLLLQYHRAYRHVEAGPSRSPGCT